MMRILVSIFLLVVSQLVFGQGKDENFETLIKNVKLNPMVLGVEQLSLDQTYQLMDHLAKVSGNDVSSQKIVLSPYVLAVELNEPETHTDAANKNATIQQFNVNFYVFDRVLDYMISNTVIDFKLEGNDTYLNKMKVIEKITLEDERIADFIAISKEELLGYQDERNEERLSSVNNLYTTQRADIGLAVLLNAMPFSESNEAIKYKLIEGVNAYNLIKCNKALANLEIMANLDGDTKELEKMVRDAALTEQCASRLTDILDSVKDEERKRRLNTVRSSVTIEEPNEKNYLKLSREKTNVDIEYYFNLTLEEARNSDWKDKVK